jgi:hypothetical protein
MDKHIARRLRLATAGAAFLLCLQTSTMAQHQGQPAQTPYAGQQTRDIKSLSDQEITDLKRGAGLGLAKAAELNGMPGPSHVLELRKELGLSDGQVRSIMEIFARMKADAIAEGEKLIVLEGGLEILFRSRQVTDGSLKEALTAIEQSRFKLRYIHLAAHLTTPPLLSDDQVKRYDNLRGYGGDPCAAAPTGHDPAMWRRHNGCKE